MKRLLVIIVTYNSAAYIARCLDSLRTQDFHSFSIIVIDNASTDDTLDALAGYQQSAGDFVNRIEVRRSPTNVGFARAVNVGLRHLLEKGYDAALLFNPDATAGTGMLADGMSVLDQDGVGACGPIVLYEDGRIWSAGGRVLSSSELLTGLHFGVACNVDKGTIAADVNRPKRYSVDALAGCAMFVSAQAVSVVGGLDERFFMYVEDTEFSVRLREHGYRLLCYTTSVAVHHTADRQIDRQVLSNFAKYRAFMSSQIRYLWRRNRIVCLVWTAKLPVVLVYHFLTRRRVASARA